MPRISSFYGIVIRMYSDDHAPPHFHARYGEYEAQVVIATGEPIAGTCQRARGGLSSNGPVYTELSYKPIGGLPRRIGHSIASILCHE